MGCVKWLPGAYVVRFHRRQKRFGHLFSERYKALVVDAAYPANQSLSDFPPI
jgi:hypothetical protein